MFLDQAYQACHAANLAWLAVTRADLHSESSMRHALKTIRDALAADKDIAISEQVMCELRRSESWTRFIAQDTLNILASFSVYKVVLLHALEYI